MFARSAAPSPSVPPLPLELWQHIASWHGSGARRLRLVFRIDRKLAAVAFVQRFWRLALAAGRLPLFEPVIGGTNGTNDPDLGINLMAHLSARQRAVALSGASMGFRFSAANAFTKLQAGPAEFLLMIVLRAGSQWDDNTDYTPQLYRDHFHVRVAAFEPGEEALPLHAALVEDDEEEVPYQGGTEEQLDLNEEYREEEHTSTSAVVTSEHSGFDKAFREALEREAAELDAPAYGYATERDCLRRQGIVPDDRPLMLKTWLRIRVLTEGGERVAYFDCEDEPMGRFELPGASEKARFRLIVSTSYSGMYARLLSQAQLEEIFNIT